MSNYSSYIIKKMFFLSDFRITRLFDAIKKAFAPFIVDKEEPLSRSQRFVLTDILLEFP